MRKRVTYIVSGLILAFIIGCQSRVPTAGSLVDELSAVHLEAESMCEPLGIDAANPRLSWRIESTSTNIMQTAYRIVVAKTADVAGSGKGDVWDSGRVDSSKSLAVAYSGPMLEPEHRYHWSVMIWDNRGHCSGWAKPSWWEMGLLSVKDWAGARWITGADSPAVPLLRTTFKVAKPVAQARLYIGAAGYYVASINGKRVGDAVLDPGFTAYNKRVLYSTYDVTDLMSRGTNALGVMLGRGFYAIETVSNNIKWWNRVPWLAKQPLLIAKLEIIYNDQTRATVVSAPDWLTRSGPTISDSLYRGETFDARLSVPGWDTPAYDAQDWANVWVVGKPDIVVNKAAKISKVSSPAPSTNLQAQTVEPMRVVSRLKAVSMTQPKPGVHVYKFPIMMAGWPRLTVSGAVGTKVILRCGEKLNADGTVNNLGDAGLTPGEIQRFEYTLAGRGTEVWAPQFTYAGFQYIQLDNFPGTPTVDSVVACVVNSDVPTIGQFSCSSDLINQVHAMCKRSVLGNLHSIPTDSPMYEKRGWCDGLLWSHAVDNFGMQSFYSKWLNDIADTQKPNGLIAEIAPSEGGMMDLSWSSVIVVLPWRLYQEYGDREAIVNHYDQIKRFVDFLSNKATNHLVTGFYGDWVPPGSVKPPEGPDLVACASYYRDAWLLSKMAALLGRAADENTYSNLAAAIKMAFNAKYFDRTNGVYRTERESGYRQTSSALPLDYGIVPADMVSLVMSNLVADIRKRNNHLNTGSFGTAALLPVLSDHDQSELAYAIASQTNYPSWGEWLANGATTTWEHWGLHVRSRNHAFLGSVDDWFYKYLAGIQPAEPGYKKVTIRPCFPFGLTWVKSSIETPYGQVSVDWKRTESDEVEISVGIPPNTTAELWLPGENTSRLLGSGRHAIRKTNEFYP